MKTGFIHIRDFCKSHEIEESFIIELNSNELVSIEIIENQHFIIEDDLPQIERMVRLHRDLEINLEGIAAIYHLLIRTQRMQDEIRTLRNRLNRLGEV